MERNIVLGTRGSRLAVIQTEQVKALLERVAGVSVEITVIKTEGDQDTETPLASFGGRGAFVTSIEKALSERVIDAAVHSLKDLPSKVPPGFELAAVPFREDPRDVIVTRGRVSFDRLPEGGVIGTGSIRRRIQLGKLRPDLRFRDIRGNIETRLGKLNVGGYDAIVLAAAGLRRLGKELMIGEYFDVDAVIPAPCQGAIGIECRADHDLDNVMERIDDPDIRACVDAERLFISVLGMGCHAPVGAFACMDRGGILFHAMAGTEDGKTVTETIRFSRDNLTEDVRTLAGRFQESLSTSNT